MVSGGSLESASVTCAATTVTVQTLPIGRLPVGSSVKLVAGPVPVVLLNATGVPAGHSSVKALAVTSRSEERRVGKEGRTGGPVAEFTGAVAATLGAASVVKLKT